MRNPATEAVIKEVPIAVKNALNNKFIMTLRLSGAKATKVPTTIATEMGFVKLLSTNVAIEAERG